MGFSFVQPAGESAGGADAHAGHRAVLHHALFLADPAAGMPVITMRLFALEKFSGTFETLMTTPVSDLQVVAAKFTAALVFYMVMWLPLLAAC